MADKKKPRLESRESPALDKKETPKAPVEKPEAGVEVIAPKESVPVEKSESGGARKGEKEGAVPGPSVAAAAMPEPPKPKDKLTQQVEGILEEDLEDLFGEMSPEEQQAFAVKGEEVAGTIKTMINSGKVAARKVLKLIKSWLQIIPGVNKFFLEQEAKIKTDKIVQVVKENKERNKDDV